MKAPTTDLPVSAFNRNVVLLSLCQALLNTGTILLVSVNALIGRELAPSVALITLPMALQFLGLMTATIPASLIMQRIGRRNGFVLGNLVGLGGALCCIAALEWSHFTLFCTGTFLLGIGIGFGMLYRFAAVEAAPEGQHSHAISLVMAGGVIAAVLGPNLAIFSRGWVGSTPFSGAFVGLLGLYGLALVLLSRVRLPQPASHLSADRGRSLRHIALQPVFLISVVAGVTSYTVMNLLMTATPLAMDRCGFAFDDAAHVIQWHVLGMFVPAFFTGRLVDRFGAPPIMLAGGALMLLCIFVNLQGQSEWHFWLALVLLGIGWCFMFVSATSYLTRAYRPEEKARTQAANEFLVFSCVSLSALLAGWLEATVGWLNMNWLMLPVVLFAMLLVVALTQWPAPEDAPGQPT
ncbi:MFS transporter [Marinobacterium nitratireducens]|uniref:MFS transporter n=1 Tax=Marinobacterium nitratireducens TaxID=518897 RepID=A0A917ZEW6_9GAMM|nr:MFS transporter [Marinobacterium nitratireducens]GGO81247.1 MFS transporter [Marinobacterium nitratireducens]